MVVARYYTAADKRAWDDLVDASRTPLFFFKRDFMEYHADRFEDCSLVICDGDDIVAALPASRHGSVVRSHGGLTYGGILTRSGSRSVATRDALDATLEFYAGTGVQSLLYKAIPQIFHIQPAQEDIYFLFNTAKTQLVRRDLSSVIDTDRRLKLSKGRRALISRARKTGLAVAESRDFAKFHQLLSSVLSRHAAAPVHQSGELELLSTRFPEQIKLHVVEQDGAMIAATLLFNFGAVVHTQYMAVSDEGKALGALDLLIDDQIDKSAADGAGYFSFGISTEEQGKFLNEGLLSQKESFGGRSIAIDTYEVTL